MTPEMPTDDSPASALDALSFRVREPAGDPEGLLILHHGRATDENDLFPLLEALDPERRLLGVTPRGPLQLPRRSDGGSTRASISSSVS